MSMPGTPSRGSINTKNKWIKDYISGKTARLNKFEEIKKKKSFPCTLLLGTNPAVWGEVEAKALPWCLSAWIATAAWQLNKQLFENLFQNILGKWKTVQQFFYFIK